MKLLWTFIRKIFKNKTNNNKRISIITKTLPTNASEIGNYLDDFQRAVEFTRSCGFDLPEIIWLKEERLDRAGEFVEPALRGAGVRDLTKSAAQCLKWCHYLAPSFEKQLGCKVFLTIGQIWKEDKAIFNPSWEDLQRWSNTGIDLSDFDGRSGFNLHAWLTLETGEIIEPTFPSTLAEFWGSQGSAFAGAVVWGREPNVLNLHRYFPMAIGSDFAERIAKNAPIPLLAQNTVELHSRPTVAVIART